MKLSKMDCFFVGLFLTVALLYFVLSVILELAHENNRIYFQILLASPFFLMAIYKYYKQKKEKK